SGASANGVTRGVTPCADATSADGVAYPNGVRAPRNGSAASASTSFTLSQPCTFVGVPPGSPRYRLRAVLAVCPVAVIDACAAPSMGQSRVWVVAPKSPFISTRCHAPSSHRNVVVAVVPARLAVQRPLLLFVYRYTDRPATFLSSTRLTDWFVACES